MPEDDHPSTLKSINNLAQVLECQGNYAEAEKMHRECLALDEKVQGDDHPMYREFLPLYEKALGDGHPHVIAATQHFAVNFWRK